MKLNCIVKHQTLTVCGPEAAEKSVNYLECVFYFLSDDWEPLEKTAYFSGKDGKTYSAAVTGHICVVPWEAVSRPGWLKISVAGFGEGGLVLTTNIASLRLAETLYGGAPSQPPSLGLYEQVMQTLSGKLNIAQGKEYAGKLMGVSGDGRIAPVDAQGGTSIQRVEHGAADTEFALPPNEYHTWGEVPTLTLTLVAGQEGMANEYMFSFLSGNTPTTFSLPETVQTDIVVEANTRYECSIVDNYMVFREWEVQGG